MSLSIIEEGARAPKGVSTALALAEIKESDKTETITRDPTPKNRILAKHCRFIRIPMYWPANTLILAQPNRLASPK